MRADGASGAAVSDVVSVTPSAKVPLRINAGGGPGGDWQGDFYHNGKYTEQTGGLVAYRYLNAAIHGVEVLKNFGIVQEGGGKTHVAVVRDFVDVTPNDRGGIEIKFTDAAL